MSGHASLQFPQMRLLIGGDLYVSDRYRGDDLIRPSVLARFAGAGFRIVNLEAPIAAGTKKRRILKTGPHLCTSKETILPLMKKLGVDLVTLANNHIMDFGRAGLAETLESLAGAGIGTVGAGPGPVEAARPYVVEREGARVAILNFGENEWASAGSGKAGANPLDVIGNVEQIRDARRTCDFAIVIIHGGQEDFPFPTPRMIRQYRFYAENGASVIIGHHPHRVSGFEIHRGAPIFYSLGNLLFTLPSGYPWWYEGLLLSLRIQRGQPISWELVPVAQSKQDFTLACLENGPRERLQREVEEYASIIADEAALEGRWQEFLHNYTGSYLNIFNPVNAVPSKPVRSVLFRLRVDRLFRRKGHFAEILNTMRCESHSEAARSVIEKLLEQDENRDLTRG